MKKLTIMVSALYLASSAMASGLFNEYKIYSFEKYEYSVDNSSVIVDMMPTEYAEDGVTVLGSPYTFRIVCKSLVERGCDLEFQSIRVENEEGVLVSLDQIEWRRFSTDKAYYQSLTIPDIRVTPEGGDACVEILMHDGTKKEFCMEFTLTEKKNFFLFDRWMSV